MRTTDDLRPARSRAVPRLSPAEKRRRLARLRQAQHQQVVRDARALDLVRSG